MAIQSFETKILKKKTLTQDIFEFELSAPENFEFKAGQFVNLKINHNGTEKFKAFSILSSPKEKGTIKLCIKSMDEPSSSSVFRSLNAEHSTTVKGPLGHFILNEDSDIKEHWFLASGTGIVPFFSMLNEYLTKLTEHKFYLIFGVRRKENRFLHEELLELERKNENFTYLPVLSREDWEGRKGHVQDFLPENFENKNFYICGLKELVIETEEILLKNNVSKERIRKERYS